MQFVEDCTQSGAIGGVVGGGAAAVIISIIAIIACICCRKSRPVAGLPVAVQPAAPTQQEKVAVPAAATDFAKLRDLKELLDGGVLTQEEFDDQKKQILQA